MPQRIKYVLFLVTARHVIEGHYKENASNIRVRLNPQDVAQQSQDFELPPLAEWSFHPDGSIDVAIVMLSVPFLKERHINPSNFFASDRTCFTRQNLKENEVSAGDGIFVLGFPMGLAGEQRNYVIARHVVIARIREMLDLHSSSFLIDAPVFPGNSGGPVVLRPEMMAIEGTKSHSSAALIGIVLSYVPYTDIAVSTQTKRPRVRSR